MIYKPPKKMWVLIDIDNGECGGKYLNYLWWFHSKADASQHKRGQSKNSRNATLVGPIQYNRTGQKKKR